MSNKKENPLLYGTSGAGSVWSDFRNNDLFFGKLGSGRNVNMKQFLIDNADKEILTVDAEKEYNSIFIGESGAGKGIHPWDNLKPCCKCGGSPWMEIEKDSNSKNYGLCKIRCLKCNFETPISSISVAKLLWNQENQEEY